LTTLSQINLTNVQYIVAYSNMGEGCKQAGDGVNRWVKGEILTNVQYILAYSNMGEGCKQTGDGVNRWVKGERWVKVEKVGEGGTRVGVKDI
jgi:hypothetical protein